MKKMIAFGLVASMFSAHVAVAGGLAPKKPSQMLTLVFYDTGSTAGCSFGTLPSYTIAADGTFAAYTGIPEGQALIVTSMQVLSYTATASRVKAFEMRTPAIVVATASCLADSTGDCQGSVTFPTGIPLSSGTTVCVDSLTPGTYQVTAQGYLTKDK